MLLSHHQNWPGPSANTKRVVGLVTGVLLWSPSEGSSYLRAPARCLSFPPDGSRVLNAERPLCLPGHAVQGHKYNAVRFIGRFRSPVHPRLVRRLIPTSTSIYGNVYARRYVNPTPIRNIKSNITSEVPPHHSRGCTSSYRAFSNFPTPHVNQRFAYLIAGPSLLSLGYGFCVTRLVDRRNILSHFTWRNLERRAGSPRALVSTDWHLACSNVLTKVSPPTKSHSASGLFAPHKNDGIRVGLFPQGALAFHLGLFGPLAPAKSI